MYAEYDDKTGEIAIHGMDINTARALNRFLKKDKSLKPNELNDLARLDTLKFELNQLLITEKLKK